LHGLSLSSLSFSEGATFFFFVTTIIWTLRSRSQGGQFKGTDEQKYAFLASLLEINPDYIDLDGDTPAEIITRLQEQASFHTKWIVSWHDFTHTPGNLEDIFLSLSQHRASFYKIATLANQTIDSLRMLNFVQKYNQQKYIALCGICMGELGEITRILAPVVGSPCTYASFTNEEKVAPGQLSIETLLDAYCFRKLHRETKILGLIGNPVDKSWSRLTHQSICNSHKLSAIYLPFLLQDEELPLFFHEIQKLPIKGLSVTMPFKEKVLQWITASHGLLACNTLLWENGEIYGFNTDGIGAIKALQMGSLQRKKILIIGAGGTARAIAQAAYQAGMQMAILNRTRERAKELANYFDAEWGSLEQFSTFIERGYQYIIQATSVGMSPAIENSPVMITEGLMKDTIALDVISSPAETLFIQQVKQQKGQGITGVELFIHQAVEQFKIWFGEQINPAEIETEMRTSLQSKLTVSL
jgi:3-dehydroquinate dehydratase/shikimate dehydrogenase